MFYLECIGQKMASPAIFILIALIRAITPMTMELIDSVFLNEAVGYSSHKLVQSSNKIYRKATWKLMQ